MNGRQLDVQHTNTGDPVTESFVDLFEGLNNVQDDLALAEALQDQESAYWSLQISFGNQGNIASTSTSSSHVHDQSNEVNRYGVGMMDITRNQDHQLQLRNDEALARSLQEVEDHNNEAHLMPVARVEDCTREHHVEINNSQATSENDLDLDNMSYEELVALGDAVGTHSRGLSQELISSLPSSKYKAKFFSRSNKKDLDMLLEERTKEDSSQPRTHPRSSLSTHSLSLFILLQLCVICHMNYKKGDRLITLPCKHAYHAECITKWLQINKACPLCYAEVFASKGKKHN